MKKLSILCLALLSVGVQAHSHYPSHFGLNNADNPVEAITFTGILPVYVTVRNINNYSQDYKMTVDGKEVAKFTLAPSKANYFMAPVELKNKSTVEKHEVCSIGLGENYNTEMCTEVVGYWSPSDEKADIITSDSNGDN